MNPDCSSDIRQVERLIFDNNIYLLTMFDKKIPSFNHSVNWENKDSRKNIRQASFLSNNYIDCDYFRQDVIKNLSRDLTKPIWNCVTRVDPKIIYSKQSSMETIEIIHIANKILDLFCGRLKNEHEDESNMKINLQAIEYDMQEQAIRESLLCASLQQITNDLFTLLVNLIDRQLKCLEQSAEYDGMYQEREYIGYEKCMLIAARELFSQYLQKNDENYNNELDIFNKIVTTSINDMINCKIGSFVLCLMPKLLTLPLLIHPMLISIHSIIKMQMQELVKKQEYKNKYNVSPTKDKYKNNENYIFGEITKSQSISKIVFLNLDGYESQFNVDIAKYLCKSLMYISFPKQSTARYENDGNSELDRETEEIEQMEDTKSQRLLKKYYMGTLQSHEKKQLLQYYKLPEKQTKKNLFMFPLHSRALARNHKLPPLYNNQTTFISFIMNELMYNQILQFNPSLIIVSYSQKICIDNEYFAQLMKELTITANYKVVFFANYNKNYVFEEFYDQSMSSVLAYKEIEEKYYQKYEQNMKIVEDNSFSTNVTMNMGGMDMGEIGRINTDMLEKISIMVKVSSGTFTLNHYKEPDCYIEKYKNYKTISYAGPLIQKLSEENQNLTKLRLRFIDYNSYSKILHNYFNNRGETFDKLFTKVIHKYYTNLNKEIQRIILTEICKEKGKVSSSEINNSDQFQPEEEKRRQDLEREQEKLKNYIQSKYNHIEIKENWNNLKLQKLLEISTEKVESKYFVHLPKYRQKKNTASIPKKQAENLICLQFYTVLEKQKIPVELCPSTSKVLYSPIRRHRNSYIYITNHLIKQSSVAFSHLCGVITQQFDTKVSPRVLLYPVTFNGGPVLTQFQTYTEFNYYESNNYIFMFWPKIYSTKLQLLNKLCNMKYSPQTTYLFFCANRKSPDNFTMIYNGNQQQNIIPRSGCQCYEVQNTNKIYIFGGFYSDQANYLLFQTNITQVTYQASNSDQVPSISVENIPKKFYFDYEEMERNREIKVITNIKNDMVRPRIQYQFLEPGKLPDDRDDQKVVFLVGGVGQKFVRPYSMIGHMAHKIIFNSKTGDLEGIKRIQMNNILPINTHAPIKMRGPMQAKILSHAQNRSINFITGQCAANSYSVFHNRITYNPENQRFEYQSQYEFCDSQLKNHREQISLLKKHINQGKQKIGIFAKCPKGKEYSPNYITLYSETNTNTKYIIQLQLCLSLDVRYTNKELPPAVRLTGASILSMDINGGIIYALIKHDLYTLNNCILAYFDLNELSPKLKQNKPIQIQLKQLHKFDENVSYDVLIAANTNTILLLHGQRFVKTVDVPELMLRRNRKKHIKIDRILPNQLYVPVSTSSAYLSKNSNSNSTIQSEGLFQQYSKIHCSNGINCSVFIKKDNGVILCLSFKTIQRGLDQQNIYFSLERLDINADKYAWQLMKEKKYKLIIDPSIHQGKAKSKRRENIRLLEIVERKQASGNITKQYDHATRKNQYLIIGYIRQQILTAQFDIDDPNSTIRFMNKNKTLSEYLKESTSIQKQQLLETHNQQQSVLLEKSLEDYNELKLTSVDKQTKFGFGGQMDLE